MHSFFKMILHGITITSISLQHSNYKSTLVTIPRKFYGIYVFRSLATFFTNVVTILSSD